MVRICWCNCADAATGMECAQLFIIILIMLLLQMVCFFLSLLDSFDFLRNGRLWLMRQTHQTFVLLRATKGHIQYGIILERFALAGSKNRSTEWKMWKLKKKRWFRFGSLVCTSLGTCLATRSFKHFGTGQIYRYQMIQRKTSRWGITGISCPFFRSEIFIFDKHVPLNIRHDVLDKQRWGYWKSTMISWGWATFEFLSRIAQLLVEQWMQFFFQKFPARPEQCWKLNFEWSEKNE